MEKNYITNGIVGGVAPTLAIATSLTNVKTTNAINFKIDGQVYSLAATNPLAPIQTTISIPTASTGSIGVYANGSTTSYVQGTTYANSSLFATLSTGATTAVIYNTLGLPSDVPGKSLLGYVIINTGTTTGYSTSGTTTLNATGFTTTYLDKFGFVGL